MCKEVVPGESMAGIRVDHIGLIKREAARQLANHLLYDGDGLTSHHFNLFCTLIHDDDLPVLMRQVTYHAANVYYAAKEIVWE